MNISSAILRMMLASVLMGGVICWSTSSTSAAESRSNSTVRRARFEEPVLRIPNKIQQVSNETLIRKADPGEHPLVPVLEMAKESLKRIDDEIKDYSCVMAKRERINGELGEYQYMRCKFRNKPYSVYMKFLGKSRKLKGREVLYVDGKNEGKLIFHGLQLLGNLHLDPTSNLAMKDNRYPVTKAGIRNLMSELIEVGTQDKEFGECEVKYFQGARVSNRLCTCVQVTHPVPRKNFRYHIARIYIDDEMQIPIRYEAYTWPTRKDGPPMLLEEYTYVQVKLNVGLTDGDFDIKNPNYNYKK